MRTMPLATEIINPGGAITALVAQEFGVLFLKDSTSADGSQVPALDTVDAQTIDQIATQRLPVFAGLSLPAEYQEDADLTDAETVFVDLRNTTQTSGEEFWHRIVTTTEYWPNEAQAFIELLSAASRSEQHGDVRAPLLALRGLYAAAELRFARHLGKQPTESDHVGFDKKLWPYRRFCIEMSSPFDLDWYLSKVGKSGKPMSWDTYHQLLPEEW